MNKLKFNCPRSVDPIYSFNQFCLGHVTYPLSPISPYLLPKITLFVFLAKICGSNLKMLLSKKRKTVSEMGIENGFQIQPGVSDI